MSRLCNRQIAFYTLEEIKALPEKTVVYGASGKTYFKDATWLMLPHPSDARYSLVGYPLPHSDIHRESKP
jgi:hypothetical protein